MFRNLFKKTFGDSSTRTIKGIQEYVDRINALEPEIQRLPAEAFPRKTVEYRERLALVTADDKEALAALRKEREGLTDSTSRAQLDLQIRNQERAIRELEEEILEEILPEAFALVREAAVRTLGMRHYDVQLIGGIVLHRGQISEMKTGEGKTLVATLPLYLNSLTGRGVHLVTPNDYLSKVGVQWMGPVYHYLGVEAAVIQSSAGDPNRGSYLYDPAYQSADDRFQHLQPISRRQAYQANITYGTNNEFGFDYLRDNMVQDLSQQVQRQLFFAIVDEVDNILIDEARTPLIISGVAQESSNWYQRFAQLVPRLGPSKSKEEADGDYVVDEKDRVVTLTEAGIEKIQDALGIDNLYSPEYFELTPYLDNALRAQVLYKRDRDYIVRNGEVVIVDEFTGRLMEGRRYSEGLHQAIEAKEGVKVQRESLTLATITFQNYFRMYAKLAGMTGTAETEKEEFSKIYGLDVVVIPTNLPVVRDDMADLVYRDGRAKFHAVVDAIEDSHVRQQPILVGTVAIETSEFLSRLLERRDIPHNVLNAKNHEREAVIIAQAGQPGTVTIATNMAGRGVDILLGGNPEGIARDLLRRQGYDLADLADEVWEEALSQAKEQCERDRQVVLAAGGLHVLGTERHEARRIDNQLRGRSGRQGDPGSSRFYVALDDDLMRRFGGERVARLMERLGVEDDTPIEHNMVSKSIENAQMRVEGHNFDIRKHVLEYDNVVNKQREVIYDQRRRILSETNLRENLLEMVGSHIRHLVQGMAGPEDPAERDLPGLKAALTALFPTLPPGFGPEGWQGLDPQDIAEQIEDYAAGYYDQRADANGQQLWRQFVDDGLTLETLAQRTDPFHVAVHAAIQRNLDGALDPQLAPLPLRQLPSEVQEAVQAGITAGAALFRDRMVMVRAVDERWVRHLTDLDALREGIGLRAFAQVDPLVAYKKEAHAMYVDLLGAMENDIVHAIYKVDVVRQQQPARRILQTNRGGNGTDRQPERRSAPSLGRNDPCWCGSGKKYKHCHLRSDQEGTTSGAPAGAKAPAAATAGGGSAPSRSKASRKRRRTRR